MVVCHAGGMGEVTAMDAQGSEETFVINLGDILAFATGVSSVPPIGFSSPSSIVFQETSPFPISNACANILKLPLSVDSFNMFMYNFCYGISNAIGFGHA